MHCNLLRTNTKPALLQLLLPTLLGLLGSLLVHLLLSRNSSLNTNAAKDKRNAEPLHLSEAMTESEY